MHALIEEFFSRQFVRFLIAGGIAALVNFGVGYCLAPLLGYELDVVAGHLSGMLVAFLLFKKTVFERECVEKSSNSTPMEVLVFIGVNGFALLQTLVVFVLLRDYMFPLTAYLYYPTILARLIAIGVPVITSFLLHKHFTFKPVISS